MKNRTFLLIGLLFVVGCTAIATHKTNHYPNIESARLVSVYDGDTFKVDIPGWPAIIGRGISIRINGIDTPERRGTRPEIKLLAEKARARLIQLLGTGDSLVLANPKRGKYFRIIADVLIDGNDIGVQLIHEGHAKPYDGGTRPKW